MLARSGGHMSREGEGLTERPAVRFPLCGQHPGQRTVKYVSGSQRVHHVDAGHLQ
jgi:hypothetical protein